MYGCLVKCGWHHAGINSGDSLAHEEFKKIFEAHGEDFRAF
jgi:hypothetical protein